MKTYESIFDCNISQNNIFTKNSKTLKKNSKKMHYWAVAKNAFELIFYHNNFSIDYDIVSSLRKGNVKYYFRIFTLFLASFG